MRRSGLVTSMSPDDGDHARGDVGWAGGAEVQPLGPLAFHLERDLLHVEDDVGHVLAHAGQRAELVQHAVDLDRGDGRALQRAQEHAAQRVAESHSEAALERLGDEHRAAADVASADLLLERVGLLQFLPVLYIDGHIVSFTRGHSIECPRLLVRASCPRAAGDTEYHVPFRSHPPPLRRPHSVVRDRGHVADRVMVKPTACSARSALSRPEPGPLTSTSRVRTPCSAAFLPASSAATCAA